MKETALLLKEKLLLEAPVLSAVGMREISIENYRFLRLLNEEEIQIQAKNCRISIAGKELAVIFYTKEAMKIRGTILSIQFQS